MRGVITASDEGFADVAVLDSAEDLDAVLELVLGDHALEGGLLRAVAANDEVDLRELLADHRDDVDEEVCALAEGESRDEDDVDRVEGKALRRVRLEAVAVDGVRDNGDVLRVQERAQRQVLLRDVRDGDNVVNIGQKELQELVHVEAGEVGEAEERVVRVDALVAHRAPVQQAFLAEVGGRRVAVDDVDALADQDLAEERQEEPDLEEDRVVEQRLHRHVVDLDAVRDVAHPLPVPVPVRHDYHLVPQLHETWNEERHELKDAHGETEG